MLTRWFAGRAWLAALLLSAVALLLYGQVVDFQYVWDDSLLFLDKTTLISEPLSWHILAQPVLPGSSYLRPMFFLSMWAEFHLWGQSPALSHLVNLALFLGNVLLVFQVSRRLATIRALPAAETRAFIAALVYAVHPALVESTSWVAGRFDLLVTLFMLAAVYVYLGRWKHNSLRMLVILLLMSAALFSKELAIALPGVLLCMWLAANANDQESRGGLLVRCLKENARLLVAMVLLLAAYMELRATGAGIYHQSIGLDYIRDAWFTQRLPLEALKHYLKESFLPFYDINPIHPVNELPLDTALSLWSGLLVGVLALALPVWAFVRRSPVWWLVLIWLGCLVPVLYLVPLTIIGNIGQERFLTAPLAFLVMVLAVLPYERVSANEQLKKWRPVMLLGGGVWMLLAVATTWSIIPFWGSDLRLWNWAYTEHPNMPVARYNYLFGALTAGRPELVDKEVTKLMKHNKGLEVGDQILYGGLLIHRNDPEGLEYIKGALYALPKFHDMPDGRIGANHFMLSSSQLGSAYQMYASGLMLFKGDIDQALKYNSISQWYNGDVDSVTLRYQRATFLYAKGEFSEGKKIIEEQEKYYALNREAYRRNVFETLAKYCENFDYSPDSCKRLVSDGLIPEPSGAPKQE